MHYVSTYSSSSSSMALDADVLMLIIEHLDVDDLVRLASTCKLFHLLVHDFGWAIFLRNNQRHSITLHSSRSRWSPFAQVRYNFFADRAWSRANFIARPLSHPWHGNLQPVIALSISTLLVAAGRVLYSYVIQDASDASSSHIVFDCSYTFDLGPRTVQPDITSIAFLPDTGQDRTVFVGFEDGFVERVRLPPCRAARNRHQIDVIERTPQSVLQRHGANIVQSISCTSRTLLSLSQWGKVILTNLTSDSSPSTSVNLDTRSWASHLCTSSSSPYAVFGTTSAAPLSLYYIAPHGFSPTPSISLQSTKNRPSAVYGITCAPPSSPLGPSEQIVVSGWYDGSVRIYDLRVSHHSQHLPNPDSASSSPPTLSPVLTLQDPWSLEPIYGVACGGGNASFIAAGTARHSVVAFWDVRQPSRGWGVYAPGNDPSPVYSLVLESSRVFGATQSRPFVYDFGPGVTRDTYPPVAPTGPGGRRRIREDELKLERDGIGYHVSKYSHRRTGIF